MSLADDLELGAEERAGASRSALTAADHPLAQRLRGVGLTEMGLRDTVCRSCSVKDDRAIPLGRRSGSDEVTLALREMDGWRSIYAVTPVLSPVFYREVARLAGVHIWNERDDTLYASRSYLTVNADGEGTRTLRLPWTCDIVDPFTQAPLARQTRSFERTLQDRETLLVRLDRPAGL